jgi:hypothetical protein
MARSKLQEELAERQERERKLLASINARTLEIQKETKKEEVTIDKIALAVTQIGANVGVSPIRPMSSFNRSFKTQDVGKITTAVASHLFGKFRVAAHLTNSWSRLIQEKKQPVENHYHRNQLRNMRANQNGGSLSQAEVDQMCEWYVVAASGGSLWREKTKNIQVGNVVTPLFTRQENHDFLTCRIKDCSFREAIIYAIAMNFTQDLGTINRICKTTLVDHCPTNIRPIEYFTKPLWRQAIQMMCEQQKVYVQEFNDILDYIRHMSVNPAYNLKGRSYASIKKSMTDWHWELSRVKKMGNADWTAYKVPVDDEEFEIPQTPGVKWRMSQITTSKALAAEGTAQRHCVYSYQSKCIEGSCAIWSLTRSKSNTSLFDRALTIEMNANASTLVQIRGIANRSPKPEEKAAVKFWANKNGVLISQYA